MAKCSSTSERLGLLGGSFNPVHCGHLQMAGDAFAALSLNKVLFIPCANPPHKPLESLAPAADRIAMLEAAVQNGPDYAISRIEIDRPGITYTIDTLNILRREKPACELFFIIGADTLFELPTWRDIDAVFELCRFAIVPRPGQDLSRISELPFSLERRAQLRNAICPGTVSPVSATEIRRRAAAGLSLSGLVPDAVAEYISRTNLYAKNSNGE